MTRTTWTIAAAVCGLGLLPFAGAAQAPRYQSPFNAPTPAPSLPTPPAITANGQVVEDVVARVNDQIISRSDVERSEQQLQQEEQQQTMSPSDREQRQKDMLRDMIDQQLLLSKAKELGLNADTEVIRRLDEIRKQNNLPDMEALEKAARQQGVNFEDFKANIRNQILTQEVVRDEVGRRLQMTRAQEQAFYDAHKSEFEQPEQVRLSEILIPTPADATEAQIAQAQKKADGIAAEVKAGKAFDALAKENSGGQTAATGGDLGEYKRGALAKVLEDQTFSLAPGQSTAPIRTKQGFVLLKVTAHQNAGVPPLAQIEPQVQEAMYGQAMQPALRSYLTRLREEAYVDIKPGFVDSGASSKQTKPVFTAYSAPVTKKQKKVEKKLRMERSHGVAVVGATKGALPPGSGAQGLPSSISGATPVPGTTAAVAAAAKSPLPVGATTAPVETAFATTPAAPNAAMPAASETSSAAASAVSNGAAGSGRLRRVSGHAGKQKKIKREKIRFGQAPRNALPAGPTEVAAGADTGAGAQSAAVTPGGLGNPASLPADAPPGAAMAPTESTTEISQSSDPDPLTPKPASTGKTRFSAREKTSQAEKVAAKQVKVQEKAAATPAGPDLAEAATDRAQAAPLGLNGDTAKKQKAKRAKGAEKERLQGQKPAAPAAAPIAPTVNPNLGTSGSTTSGATPANPAPDSNEKNTTLPSSTVAPGAPEQGQPLSPTGSPSTTPNGTPAPQPQ